MTYFHSDRGHGPAELRLVRREPAHEPGEGRSRAIRSGLEEARREASQQQHERRVLPREVGRWPWDQMSKSTRFANFYYTESTSRVFLINLTQCSR